MPPGFFGNLIFAIIARMMCGNHLKLPNFSLENVVPITHEQNIICSKTRLDVTTHEQTIIFRQLFAGHVVGSRRMER